MQTNLDKWTRDTVRPQRFEYLGELKLKTERLTQIAELKLLDCAHAIELEDVSHLFT